MRTEQWLIDNYQLAQKVHDYSAASEATGWYTQRTEFRLHVWVYHPVASLAIL